MFLIPKKNKVFVITTSLSICFICLAILTVFPAFSHADELSEAQAALDEVKAQYDQSVQEYGDALVVFEKTRSDLSELREIVSEDKKRASASAKILYKSHRESLSTLSELFFSPSGFEDVLNYIDSMQRAYEYHSEILEKSKAECEALAEKEREYSEKAIQAQKRKEELDSSLNAALAAYESVKHEQEERKKREEEEAKAREEAAAAYAFSGSSSSSGEDQDSDYDYEDVSYEHNWVTGEEESEVTVSIDELMFMGVIYANGYRYTYYNESVLPGPGLSIPGRHHEDGMICDGDGYICVASSDLPWGTVVPTPLGRPGKVYDCGCASGTIDLYLV